MSGAQPAATLLTFRWGDTRCAAPLEGVREVLRLGELVAVPGAPPPLAGLLDVRGHPLPVLDLRFALLAAVPAGAAGTAQPPRDVLVIRHTDGGLLGLLCDAVLGVGQSAPAAELPRGLPAFVTGVQPGPVPVVDLALLVAALAPAFATPDSATPDSADPAAAASAAARACAVWTRTAGPRAG